MRHRPRGRRARLALALTILAGLAAAAAMAAPGGAEGSRKPAEVRAQGATFNAEEASIPEGAALRVVNKKADTNDGVCDLDCSLREAVGAANPGDVVVFSNGAFGTAQTITLTLGELTIDKDLTVFGTGQLYVSGNGSGRVLRVAAGSAALVSALSITGGAAGDHNGAGVLNSGTLTLQNCAVSGNSSAGRYGGIVNNAGATLSLLNSTVSGNTAAGPFNGTGGVANFGTLLVVNSTVSGNVKTGGNLNAGGVFNSGAARVVNSTVTNNAADGANSAAGALQIAGTFAARNSIIAAGQNNAATPDVKGTFASEGHNLVGNRGETTDFTRAGDRAGTGASPLDPRLGPLAFNGGPTQTHAPLIGSPAVDAGDNCVTSGACAPPLTPALAYDQRGTLPVLDLPTPPGAGFERARDGDGDGTAFVDVGAFEVLYETHTWIVTNTDDHGVGSLRQALLDSQGSIGPDVINFELPTNGGGCAGGACTITLTGGELPAAAEVAVNGPGATLLTVSGNSASRVFHVAAGTKVKLAGLTVFSGSADEGAGILNRGTLELRDCALVGNTAVTKGAGISNHGDLRLVGVTVSGNIAGGTSAGGGGIDNAGSLKVTNSTVSGNSKTQSGGAGGLYNRAGTADLFNATITDNGVGGAGGAGGVLRAGGTVTLRNSIVAGNRDNAVYPDAAGAFSSGGFNLIGNPGSATGFGQAGDQAGTPAAPLDPKLDPLALNGGRTRTHRLLPDSPALDKGGAWPGATTDQRGALRPADYPTVANAAAAASDGSDIGAYESSLLVTNTNDGGEGSLRQALLDAQATDFVQFDPLLFKGGARTLRLTGGGLLIGKNLTVTGPGVTLLTIESQSGRVLSVAAGAAVTFRGLGLGGSSADGDGGVIVNAGALTLEGCSVKGGTASRDGGNIHNLGTLDARDCAITGGVSGRDGGGVLNDGAMTLRSTLVFANISANVTGGILNRGRLRLIDSAVVANRSLGGSGHGGGGGIGNTGDLHLANTTVSSNQYGRGAGLWSNTNGSVTIVNSTITANDAASGPAVAGGVYCEGGVIVIRNSIVAGNKFNDVTPDVIAAPQSGSFASGGHNLIGNAGGVTSFDRPGDRAGGGGAPLDPLLDEASEFGGRTFVHSPLPGSPAIDAGDDCVLTDSCPPAPGAPLTFDQRGAGFGRAADGDGDGAPRVDIGAVEVQTLAVTNTKDGGPGSLRQAIADAKGLHGTQAINFKIPAGDPGCGAGGACVIRLTGGQLEFDSHVAVNGPGARKLVVSGNRESRVFLVNALNVFNPETNLTKTTHYTVTLRGLTVGEGAAQNGGGIINFSRLTVRGCVVADNSAGQGKGGGIMNLHKLDLVDSTVSGNTAGAGGGGLDSSSDDGHMRVVNSTISGNTSGDGPSGGGILAANPGGVTISGSTIYENSAGGGAHSVGGVMAQFGEVKLLNTIVARNRSNGSPHDVLAQGNAGKFTSLGHNLIGNADAGAGFDRPGDLVGGASQPLNPMLAPLAHNGAQTRTHALLPGSPAFDAGTSAGAEPADQRGVARVGAPDIGAFESRGFTISAAAGSGQTAKISTAFASPLTATVASPFGEPVEGGRVTFRAPQTGASCNFLGGITDVAIGPDGAATSRRCTANGLTGAYVVTAGAKGVAGQAPFELANTDTSSTTTAIASSANPSEFGQGVTFTANVTSAGGTPTGSIQFKADGANLGAPVSLSAGAAQLTVSTLAPGSHAVSAEYGGDANFAPSAGMLAGGQMVKAQPALSVGNVSVSEGDGGATQAVFAVTLSAPSALAVTVNYSTSDGTAAAPSDYQAAGGTLTFEPGATAKTVAVNVKGDTAFEPDEGFVLNLSGASHALAAAGQGRCTILNDDPEGGTLRFGRATYTVGEGDGFVAVTVERAGDLGKAVSVDYETSDLSAAQRTDHTAAFGRLSFAPGESSKSFNVLITQDSYVEGAEALRLALSDPSGGAVVGQPSTATLEIVDDVPETPGNPNDQSAAFVRQHYHDFLSREPDPAGLQFWVEGIESCGQDAGCREARRINTSAAFFLSIEFQQTGFFVTRMWKVSYGDLPRYPDFLRDTQEAGRGVVVGQPGWQQRAAQNKQALGAAWVGRAEFAPLLALGNAEYVDRLYQNAGVTPPAALRAELVGGLESGAETRASALLKVAGDGRVADRLFSEGFVLMQYFGYLRRGPDEWPDANFDGYHYWLHKLNAFGGDFVRAEMVRSFLASSEYRSRFGGQP